MTVVTVPLRGAFTGRGTIVGGLDDINRGVFVRRDRPRRVGRAIHGEFTRLRRFAMSRKLVHSGFPALCVGVGCLVAMAGTQVNGSRSAASDAAAADEPVLSIDVKAVAKDSKPTERKFPQHY